MQAPPAWRTAVALLGLALAFAAATPVGALADPADVDPDSIYRVAGKLYSTERYAEAIPLFEQVLSLEPRFANAYALLGSSFLHLGFYDKAIANFEKALGLDEGIKLAYLGLITANYYTAKIEVAQKWARKCLPVLSPGEKGRWLSFLEKKFPELGIGLTAVPAGPHDG